MVDMKTRECPICQCTNLEVLYEKQRRKLLICEICRHIFWREKPSPNELSEYYSNRYGTSHNQIEIQKKNLGYYVDHIAELIDFSHSQPSSSTIVDFGSSYPILLMKAKEMGFNQVIGVDWDSKAIDYGMDHGILMMTPAEFTKSIADSSADIVRFSHVIEHPLDPVLLLQEVARKIRPGGLLYITQPNLPVFAFQQSPSEIPDAVWPEHLHFFSALSLCDLVSRVGLKVAKFSSHQNANEVLTKYALQIDYAYAAKKLLAFADLSEPSFGRLCNYPIYAGKNSVMYAIRK